jgi:hypothetical protein
MAAVMVGMIENDIKRLLEVAVMPAVALGARCLIGGLLPDVCLVSMKKRPGFSGRFQVPT